MKIWLDDKCDTTDTDRATPEGWTGVKTSQEVIALLETGGVEALSLDHDLGDKTVVGDGNSVLTWLELAVAKRGFIPPAEIKMHSANPAVYPKMLLAIESIKRLAAKNSEER